MIVSKTPFRISLFGGGTDFPVWYNNNKSLIISATINKYCYVIFKKLNETVGYKYKLRYFKNEYENSIEKIKHPVIKELFKKYLKNSGPIELIHAGDLPAQTGLGASSAFSVGVINAIHKYKNIKINNFEAAKIALNLEQNILKEYVGSQDQIACANGGFNFINFNKNKISINNMFNKNKSAVKRIENHMVLFFTGIIRNSQIVEKDKLRKINSNSKHLNELYNQAVEAKKIILKNSKDLILDISKILEETWRLKKKLSNKVTNTKIDNLYDYAKKNGALAGKLLGAGSGGFMIFLVKNKSEKLRLINSLKNLERVEFKFENYGSRTFYLK